MKLDKIKWKRDKIKTRWDKNKNRSEIWQDKLLQRNI